MLLHDRIVLVTGSTTGIGAATVRQCVAEGARVMIHGRDEPRARALAQEFTSKAHYFTGDLADPVNCEKLVESTIRAFGRLDGVVNNAALMTRSNLETTDVATFDRVMAVNLRAPLLIIRAALPHFRKQEGGVVVNIGSVNGLCGESNQLGYSIAKGGLITLTRNLADAHAAENIRINQINVGWTLTENELALKKKEGLSDGWQLQVPTVLAPMGRLTSPEEIANHIVFWLSEKSAPINGAVYEAEQFPLIGRNPSKIF